MILGIGKPRGASRAKARAKTESLGPGVRDMVGLSHIEAECLVASDGRRVSVFEVGGREFSPESIGSFGRMINTMNFNVQILVRQHQPSMKSMRSRLRASREPRLTGKIDEAAESLDRMLEEFETREGMFDRSFYIVCNEEDREKIYSELRALDIPMWMLNGRPLRELAFAIASGCSPRHPENEELDDEFDLRVKMNSIEDSRGVSRKVMSVRKWPRSVRLGFIQRIMQMGIPMELSIHLSAIDGASAASKLEFQKTRMESSRNIAVKQGRSVDPAIDIAIEDVMNLREAVQRGEEKIFDVSVSMMIYADTKEKFRDYSYMISSYFTSVVGEIDNLYCRQLAGARSVFPLCNNPVGEWNILKTSNLAVLFPFNPPNLDFRTGTLFGVDERAACPVTFDIFSDFPNHNMAVLATSGAGKSFSIKLDGLRNMERGVRLYIIDPEGEYVDMAHYAGGRVMTPGIEGQGMNPFTIEKLDAEDITFRIGNLQRVVRMMIGDHLGAVQRGALDYALTEYYERVRQGLHDPDRDGVVGFSSFCGYLERDPEQAERVEIASMLKPFSAGSLRHLLTDEGSDLLVNEPMITVFDLHLVEDDMRAVAAMICTETVWAMAARDPRPRRLIVDEVWAIIKQAAGAEFMLNVAKRARKHKFGVTSITQDVQDLLAKSDVGGVVANSGRALLQNASVKLLLKQDAAAVSVIRDTFDLPEESARGLVSARVGNGLLVSSQTFIPIQIEATPEEIEILEWKAGRDAELFGGESG